jgi:DNA (cytosine-5)-methyltransferase 1
MVQTGFGEREGQAPRCLDIEAPLGTVVAQGIKYGLVAATLMTNTTGHAPTELGQPVPTLATGNHQALVAAFLQSYYTGGGQHQDPADPLHTVTTLARHGLVTVEIDGATYVITDIGMRMLEPRELARAMGFPEWYRFDGEDGKPLTKRDQVKMIGNAVPTGLAKALVKAVVLQRPDVFGLVEEVA